MDILILLFLIFLNGLLSMSELALVSARKIRLQQWADDGKKGAHAALALANEPTRLLSTIQVGITLISITSGVYGEAAISLHVQEWLMDFSLIAAYSKPLSVAIVVFFITILSLIFGELVPKRLAIHNPELIATILSRPMNVLAYIISPLVQILTSITDALLKIMGVKKNNEPSITEEEIRVLMGQGAEEGVIDRVEQELVENIFRLDDRRVVSIMTPRKDIIFIDIEDSHTDNFKLLANKPYSRFPVCKGGMESIIGILESKRMLQHMLAGKTIDFCADVGPPLYVPATVSLMRLLEQFKLARTHIALVVDEYGELEGLVTMNDVLEAIVGDMPALDHENHAIVERDPYSWLIDGALTLDEFKEFFDIDHETLLPGEDTGNIHTLGGVLMYQLGRIPTVADKIEWQHFGFEVVDMDKTRVDKVMVVKKQSSEENPQ